MRSQARRDGFVAVAVVPLFALLGALLVYPTVALAVHVSTAGGPLALAGLRTLASAEHDAGLADAIALAATSALVAAAAGAAVALGLRALPRLRRIRPALARWASAAARLGGAPLAFVFVSTIGLQAMLTGALLRFDPPTVATLVLFQFPLILTIALPAVGGLPETWTETAAALGVGRLRYWRTVVLPVLAPSAVGGWLILFASAFTAVTTARIVGSGLPMHIHPLVGPAGPASAGEVDLALATGMVAALLACLVIALPLLRRTLRWTRG